MVQLFCYCFFPLFVFNLFACYLWDFFLVSNEERCLFIASPWVLTCLLNAFSRALIGAYLNVLGIHNNKPNMSASMVFNLCGRFRLTNMYQNSITLFRKCANVKRKAYSYSTLLTVVAASKNESDSEKLQVFRL